MFGSAGVRRAVLVALAVVTVAASACSSGDSSRELATVKKPTRTTLATTTTSTIAPPVQYAAPPTGAKRVRVSVLPGDRPAKPVKQQAAYRGPQPTGRIIIPRIGLNHLTYEGIELSTIDYGPSHWPGTAMPGQNGNTVFPGHRVTHSRPFYNIDLVQIGDQVIFETAAGRFTYEVTETFVVDDEETWIADPSDTPIATIFGCHPKHSAKQRYVVRSKLVDSKKAYSSTPPPNDGRTAPGDNNSYEPPPPPPEETTTTTPSKGLIPRIGG